MSEVDDNGQVLTQITDVGGPVHFATTTEHSVLVADQLNSHVPNKPQILLFNSQLQLERVLLDTNSQVKPWHPLRLHYNKLTSQLYVIHNSDEWKLPTDVISQWSLR